MKEEQIRKDLQYMKRAMELAEKGRGRTNPNPMVGAVIVKENRIIGEGYHEAYGTNHAEVNAFESANEDCKGATLYVTLEPCHHYGKTPPCVDRVIQEKVTRVVIGLTDPNPLVMGKSIKKMTEKGIDVHTGVLEEELRKQNRVFLHYIQTGSPYITLKTAMTLDGKIATVSGESKWITGKEARQWVHGFRDRVMGIMVGVNTVIADDPLLTTRLEQGQGKNPIRIVVDSQGRAPLNAKVFDIDDKRKTILATTESIPQDKVETLEKKGVKVVVLPKDQGRVDLRALMTFLGEEQIDSVLLEGGATLNYSALKNRIVQEVVAFIAPKLIGGLTAKTPVGGEGIPHLEDAIHIKDVEFQSVGEDVMVKGLINQVDIKRR